MSATYQHTPISIPDIFAALVAEMATNLGIPIKFKHGTWVVVQNELIVDNKSANNAVKNWSNCIALIHDTDEKPSTFISESFAPRIVIVTNSEATWKSQKRNDENYIPTLYPMWAELGQVIADSTYFLGYINPILPKRDLYHIGTENANGKDGYLLPKVLDGLIIEGANLQLNLDPMCGYTAPNLCEATPCPYGLETYYENIFKNVTFTGVGTAVLSASVNDYDFVSIGPGLPPPFAPEIDWFGDGNFVSMDVPTAPALAPFTASTNLAVSNPYGDGVFRGVIKNGPATVEFYYKVLGGIIVKMISEIEQAVEYSVSCADYPNYPATISGSITWVRDGLTEPFTMNGYSLTAFGQTKATESFAATDTYSKTTETTITHMGSNQTIVNNFSFTGQGGQSPLAMTSIYRTRCKSSF